MKLRREHFYPVFLVGIAFAWVLFWSSRYSDVSALKNEAGEYFGAAIGILNGTRGRLLEDASGATFSDVAYSNVLATWFLVLPASVKSAQILNGLLWSGSVLLVFLLLRSRIGDKKAFITAAIAASSPTLTSFSGKVYSEHLAIFSGLLCLFGFSRRSGSSCGMAILGGTILVLTKSAFFYFFVLLIPFALLRKDRFLSIVSIAVVLLALPVQNHLQRGKRGVIQVAAQTAKLDLFSYPTIFKCAIYNLSLSLGQKIYPDAEGACRLNTSGLTQANHELNYQDLAFRKVEEGFTYRDGVILILHSPFKYALIGLSNLSAAFWIEGVYPDPIQDASILARQVFWVFKAVYSMFLWLGVFLFFRSAFRNSGRRGFAILLASPILYVLFFQINVPPEQRYFFTLIPLMYLAAGYFYSTFSKTPTQPVFEPIVPREK